MSNRYTIIQKLSYHQYEPISYLDFKNSKWSNENLCYKKEIMVEISELSIF
ncbi:Uncharacterised protein [Actinobacillus equuli]|nr:Uncharacterised protein [Actinobacillus equuli]